MKSYSQLPEGYQPLLKIDLQKDKKLAWLINGISLLICAVMVVPMLFFIPFSTLVDFDGGAGETLLKLGVTVLSIIAYMILHEGTHALAMRICGTKKVKFGITGLYAFAGSDDYYRKGSYIFIALAPVVLWGIALLLCNLFLPTSWFWVVYLVQVINVSGATGDYYVSLRFAFLPKDILICDQGVGMTVYTKE